MNSALCFLIVNQIENLPELAIKSALEKTNAPIFVGYLNIEDLREIPKDPRISYIDLNSSALELGLEVKSTKYVSFDNNFFFSLVQLKWKLFQQILESDQVDYLVYIDLDVVIVKDFLKEFDRVYTANTGVEVLVQHFTYSPAEPRLCMGIFAIRRGIFSENLISDCARSHFVGLTSNPRLGDDDVITDFYLQLENKSQFLPLPQQSFPVGNLINLFLPFGALPGLRPGLPYVFHANFVVGNRKKVLLLHILLYRMKMVSAMKVLRSYSRVIAQSIRTLILRIVRIMKLK